MSVTAAPTYQFSVEEYHRLGEAGIFHEDDRVELLGGNIVIMAPIGIQHVQAVPRLNRVFHRRLSDRCIIDAQNPVTIDGQSEPQPDILLLKLEAETANHLPTPQDVFLLVEVADSSLLYDRTDKRAAYARTGIAEYWLLDLTRNELLVWRDPAGGEYRTELRLTRDQAVAPLAFPDAEFAVADLLPA